MKSTLFAFFLSTFFISTNAQRVSPDTLSTGTGTLIIQPIQHASLILTVNNLTIYADPNNAENFKGLAGPDIILITDIHGDHFDPKTLDAVLKPGTLLIVPQVVADKLTGSEKEHVVILKNGDQTQQSGISILAIPMYNLPESPTRPCTPRGVATVMY